MRNSILAFVAFAVLGALLLWALSQFETLDPTILKFVRIAVLVVLSVLLFNLLLVILFHQTLWQTLGSV